jgi:NAD-dependent SIR2 family protein deacetylase
MNIEEFLKPVQRLLLITGAGCSTASGIGDYRDENGDWKRVQPVQHQDFITSHAWRQRYWARSQVGYPEFMRAKPNAAHEVLADWETSGRVLGLITQNVDRLHQRAGHEVVIDLHGRLDQVVCMTCETVTERLELQRWLDAHNELVDPGVFDLAPDGDADLLRTDFSNIEVPSCLNCGGILKPHVVFFGDSVPRDRVEQAYAWVDDADAVLVVGSSLMVYSSFRFVRRAHESGTRVAAINRGKTRADDWLAVKLETDCSDALAQIQGF